MSKLRVFLIFPTQLLVYSLDQPQTKQSLIVNAMSLEEVGDLEIDRFVEVSGMVTPEFKVNPTVLEYPDKYEIVYSLPDKLVKSDGTEVSSYEKVVSSLSIKIPDMGKFQKTGVVTPLNLPGPHMETLNKFVRGKEEPCTMKSPSPRCLYQVPDTDIQNIKQELADLKSSYRALTQRIYQIYPVELPMSLKSDGASVKAPVISVDELMKKMTANEVDSNFLDPILQPFAGSHRSNNRLISFKNKDGSYCHVRASYDPKTNKIDHPK